MVDFIREDKVRSSTRLIKKKKKRKDPTECIRKSMESFEEI